MGLVPHLRDLRDSLPLQGVKLRILHHADQIASGPGISCHSLSQAFVGVSMSLRIRARVAGSFRRSMSFAVPPSCAQGGMKARKR